ncbi:MAG: hypothetical protein JJU13_02245 [Balneolaceae bacterium]|nr:hypothetical protein [Balneolaceae bacterium]
MKLPKRGELTKCYVKDKPSGKSSDEFFKKYTNDDNWDDPGLTRLMTLQHFYS